MNLTEILVYYLKQYPFLMDYFDFFRNAFLGVQMIALLIFVLTSKKKGFLFYYLSIFLLTYLLVEFLKTLFPYPRPVTYYFSFPLLFDSFPSQHTALSFALSFASIFQNFKFGLFSFALSFLIAIFSWLSLKHWLLDIFWGMMIGFLIFLFLRELLYFFYWLNWQKRKNKS